MLNNLVLSSLGTSTLDEGVTVTLDGESVLADVNPPDILDGAGTLAVDTLDLVCMLLARVSQSDNARLALSDDSVLERCAVLKNENGVSIATLRLTSAGLATAVGLHATVEGARDGLSLLVGDRALGGGDRNGGTLLHSKSLSRGGSGRASGDGGHEGGNSGENGELHVVGLFVL